MNGRDTIKWTLIGFLIMLAAAPSGGLAQDSAGEEQTYSQQELDRLLAPIALHPDPLLAQILVAATYPDEVLEADQWVKRNSSLTREAMNDLLDQQDWDLSVKALVPFPDVLSMMSERINWLEEVGDAFLAQEEDVVDTIQTLRARARAQGNLNDSAEQRVTAQEDVIQIAPADTQIIYVPVYDPCWVYGSWWWPEYPYYCISPGAVFGFGAGIWVGRAWCHGWGHWNWHHHHHGRHHHYRHHHLITNVNRHQNINRDVPISRIQTSRWQHDPNRGKRAGTRSAVSPPASGKAAVGSVDSRRQFRGHDQGGREPGSAAPAPQGLRAPRVGTGSGQSVKPTLRAPRQPGGGSPFDGHGGDGQVRRQSDRGATSRGSATGGSRGGSQGGSQGGRAHGGGSGSHGGGSGSPGGAVRR